MSGGQLWPNAILERERLALRWHMQGLLGYGRWTNIENQSTECIVVSTCTVDQEYFSGDGEKMFFLQIK